jgi:hypothetical protein
VWRPRHREQEESRFYAIAQHVTSCAARSAAFVGAELASAQLFPGADDERFSRVPTRSGRGTSRSLSPLPV